MGKKTTKKTEKLKRPKRSPTKALNQPTTTKKPKQEHTQEKKRKIATKHCNENRMRQSLI